MFKKYSHIQDKCRLIALCVSMNRVCMYNYHFISEYDIEAVILLYFLYALYQHPFKSFFCKLYFF